MSRTINLRRPSPEQAGGADWPPTAPGDETPGDSPAFPVLAPPVEPEEIGRLGNYRVLRLLGRGGMALVFHAEDVALRRAVALKVMRPDLDQDQEGWERFLREARLMASIKHEHLVTVFQVGQEGRLPYLAMELLQGESLHERLERSEKIRISDVLRIGGEIASGLAVIHRHGLIHRDVKPANIWLESPAGRVKILDFGLARVVADDARLTQSGMIVGTPSFMSPEQARGETLDVRSDLFSLGCILYELCSGIRPFGAATTMAVLTALAVKDPQPVQEIRGGLPRDLCNLVMQLLAKDREQRPESADAVLARLRGIESRRAVRSPGAGLSSATVRQAPLRPKTASGGKRVRPTRRRWIMTGLAVVLPALVVATVASTLLAPAVPGRPNANNVVFLNDLKPIDDNNPITRPPHPPGDRNSPPFAGVMVHQQPSPHGIFMHPPTQPNGGSASLRYHLDKHYRAFSAETSLNDGPPECATPLTFSVFGDGRLLWQSSPVRRQADVNRCEVSVMGVDLLTIQVDCPGPPFGAHAVWIEPNLAP